LSHSIKSILSVTYRIQAPLGLSGATAATAGNAGDLSVPLLAARAQDRLLQQHHNENNHGDDHDVSGSGSSSGAKFILKEGLLLCIPTGFDLAATTLMNVGLLYVAASGGCCCPLEPDLVATQPPDHGMRFVLAIADFARLLGVKMLLIL
jgi:hypothetical protein